MNCRTQKWTMVNSGFTRLASALSCSILLYLHNGGRRREAWVWVWVCEGVSKYSQEKYPSSSVQEAAAITSQAVQSVTLCRLEISIEVNSWPALFQVPASPRRATRSSSTWRARVTWPWTAVNATRLAGTCHADAQRSGPPDSLSLFYFCQIDSSIALFLMQCCFHHWKKCPRKPIGLQKGRVGKKPSALPPPHFCPLCRECKQGLSANNGFNGFQLLSPTLEKSAIGQQEL